MFAKPFVGALDGHTDAVYRMATSRQSLAAFLTGACDGEIKLWDLPRQRCVKSLHAHAGYVRGLAVSHDGRHFFSCGDDKNIKQHRMSLVIRGSGSRAASRGGKSQKGGGGGEPSDESESEDSEDEDDADAAVATWHGKEPFMCAAPRPSRGPRRVPGLTLSPSRVRLGRDLDHHWREPLFATAGTSIHVWDHTRCGRCSGGGERVATHPRSLSPPSSDPVHTYSWGADTIQCVRFNPAEPCLIGSTASDRNVCLYDTRGSTPVRKLVMGMRSNALAWNPMEPFNFTVVRAAVVVAAVAAHSPRRADPRCWASLARPTRTTTATRSTCAACSRRSWSTATTCPLCACPARDGLPSALPVTHCLTHLATPQHGRGVLPHRPRVRHRLIRPHRAHLQRAVRAESRGVPHTPHAAVRARSPPSPPLSPYLSHPHPLPVATVCFRSSSPRTPGSSCPVPTTPTSACGRRARRRSSAGCVGQRTRGTVVPAR